MIASMTTSARLRLGCLLAIVLLAPTCWGAGRGPQPAVSIALEPLGYEPLTTQFMLAGSSMLTVHFVDERHLLLTYSSKHLLKRLQECPPEDQDRVIEALLLELPTGKVLARTEWRVHDRDQYLWNLGKGRFLLRVRGTLATFAPLANLASGQPFALNPVVVTRRLIAGILLSPDADLLIIESKLPKNSTDSVEPAATNEEDAPNAVQIDFFRVSKPEPGDAVVLRGAGRIYTRGTGRIPANSAGYVAILDQGQQRWAFDFRAFSGKVKELSGFVSTCRPITFLVSRSEFVAFGCHQSHSPQVIGGFNLRGEEMWERSMSENYVSPSFVFAPSGGRFALGRLILHTSFDLEEPIQPELLGPQTVVVYQTDSGKQILRVDCSPIERAGQNFDLSPDGMDLAVIRNDAIEIYDLPPLTPEEQKAVQLAKASEPQESDSPVNFGAASQASEPQPTATSDTSAQIASAPQTTVEQNQSNTTSGSPTGGDVSPTPTKPTDGSDPQSAKPEQGDRATDDAAPRKPPTLYTRPDDKQGTTGSDDSKQTPQ